ncbi:hypothetical protein GOV06_05580 [Candidatus Woesearchaeota archaeon]|nr:hypothetical protein [Candidatus Woesearchaeota archaeon]
MKVDDFISKVTEEVKKEKRAALISINKAKLQKELKSHGISSDLKALNDRAGRLGKVVAEINTQFGSIMVNIKSLREQKKNKRIKLNEIKRDVKKLKGIEKEIKPLQTKAKELTLYRNKKQAVLSIKKNENRAKSAQLTRKKKELKGLNFSLNEMQAKIKELLVLKKQKENLRKTLSVQVKQLQLRLNNLMGSLDNLKSKQIVPLHSQIAVLSKKKKEKSDVYGRLRQVVSRLQRSVIKRTNSLNNLVKIQQGLQERINSVNRKIREKELKQRRLLKLKQDIPLTAKKISELGNSERDLIKKKVIVLNLKRKIRAAQEQKRIQKKKIQEAVKKLKEQAKKLKKVNL